MRLLLLILALFSPAAMAGYANPVSLPSGWAQPSIADMRMAAPAANEAVGPGWRGTAPQYNVAGRAVTMPAYYRVAANAPRIAARVFLGPAGIALSAAAWAASECLEFSGGQFRVTCGGSTPPPAQQFCRIDNAAACGTKQELATAAGASLCATFGWTCFGTTITSEASCGNNCTQLNLTINRQQGPHTTDISVIAQGGPAVTYPYDITPQQAEDRLAATTAPDAVLRAIPGGVPVELPVLNPSSFTPSGAALPLTVPTAAPRPVPNTNPQLYEHPVVELWPMPTPESPFRIDEVPRVIVNTNPAPIADPATGPSAAPSPPPFEMPCGVGGKPACNVKVDETGTPTQPNVSAADAALTAAQTARASQIEGATNRTTLPWTLPLSLPTGMCQPLQFWTPPGMPDFKADPCTSPQVALWRTLLAWWLAAVTGLYIWRSATAATGS